MDDTLLPPIARPSDDPVIVALGSMHGIDFEALMGTGRQIKHHLDGERDPRLPDGLPSLSIGLAGGNYTGQTIIAFGDDANRYQRANGKATVCIPHGAIPDTMRMVLEGQRVRSIIDVPGIGDWIVHAVEDDVVSSQLKLRILPS